MKVLLQIFPTQESNQGLLHCRWILYQLSYQGSPSDLRPWFICSWNISGKTIQFCLILCFKKLVSLWYGSKNFSLNIPFWIHLFCCPDLYINFHYCINHCVIIIKIYPFHWRLTFGFFLFWLGCYTFINIQAHSLQDTWGSFSRARTSVWELIGLIRDEQKTAQKGPITVFCK